MLVSLALLFAILIWTATVTTFSQLLIARCLSGFVSAAGEVREVSDERVPDSGLIIPVLSRASFPALFLTSSSYTSEGP
jgi:hypothetical protein